MAEPSEEKKGGEVTWYDQPVEEAPPAPAPASTETTQMYTLAGKSVSTELKFSELLTSPEGTLQLSKFAKAIEPLPPEPPPPPQRPPFHLRVALFLPWRQTWTMKGLSRGRLLQSLSLAPQEEATIELLTWERRRKTLEQSTETDTEQTVEGSDTTKDTSEVYDEVQRQSDFQYQVGGSLRATYRPGAAEIEIGANAQLSGKSAVNQVGRTTQGRLHEAVIKASTKVRTQRTTRITETVESGSEQRVTRRIRNPNMCHTLNLDYYEVLAHYDITTEFLADGTTLCAMVLNPISVTAFQERVVLTNETTLRDALLERALLDGFDAIRLLRAYDEAKLELKDRKTAAAEAAKVGTPMMDKKKEDEDPPPTKQEADVLDALTGLLAAAKQFTENNRIDPLLNAIGRHDTISDSLKGEGRRWIYVQLVEAKFPNFASTLRSLAVDPQAPATVAWKTRLSLARRVAAAIPTPTGNPTLANLNDLTDADKENAGLGAAIHRHMDADWDWGWWSGQCRTQQVYTPNDMGVASAAQRLADKVTALDTAPTVAAATGAGQAMIDAADQKQTQQAAEDVLEMKFGLEEVGRARERRDTLLAHLNDHLDYYRFALFQALPPSEQLSRLTNGSGGALRVGMFEPRVVSMNGPYLAVPLHTAGEDLIAQFRETIVASLSTIKKATTRIMLPTPGLTIESRLGTCTGCEDFIEQSRTIELRRLTAEAHRAELEAEHLSAQANGSSVPA